MHLKDHKPVRVDTSVDTANSKAFTDRAAKVGEVAPSADLYNKQSDLKAALDALAAEGPQLVAAEAQVVKDEAQASKSRGARDALLLSISGTYNVAVATLEKHARNAADVTDCGFEKLERKHYPVIAPVDVLVKFDKAKERIDVNVKHAPGMHACHVELSPEPVGPNTWKRLDGIAAEYHLTGYAPGIWWVRAQSVRGAEVSPWFGPVSVTVK
jgi:hypothetical protein